MTLISFSQVHVGLELPVQEFVFVRADLINTREPPGISTLFTGMSASP